MHISPFVSSESVLLEVATSTTFEEYDSENSLHYCEDDGQSTMCRRPTGPTASQYARGSMWLVLHGGLSRFSSKWLVVPPYIYEGAGLKWRHTTHHSPPNVETL